MMIFNETIQNSIPELTEFILRLKRSYFTVSGKPEAGWNPLKKRTVSKKRKAGYEDPEAFNYATGKLRDSCRVSIEYQNKQLIIECSFDAMPDNVMGKLRFTYGRDFLTFTDKEKLIIVQKAAELIERNKKR